MEEYAVGMISPIELALDVRKLRMGLLHATRPGAYLLI